MMERTWYTLPERCERRSQKSSEACEMNNVLGREGNQASKRNEPLFLHVKRWSDDKGGARLVGEHVQGPDGMAFRSRWSREGWFSSLPLTGTAPEAKASPPGKLMHQCWPVIAVGLAHVWASLRRVHAMPGQPREKILDDFFSLRFSEVDSRGGLISLFFFFLFFFFCRYIFYKDGQIANRS